MTTQNKRSYLSERGRAREDGDNLAAAVKLFLKGKLAEEDLCLALMTYCGSQGWNGPACNMVGDLIDWEND